MSQEGLQLASASREAGASTDALRLSRYFPSTSQHFSNRDLWMTAGLCGASCWSGTRSRVRSCSAEGCEHPPRAPDARVTAARHHSNPRGLRWLTPRVVLASRRSRSRTCFAHPRTLRLSADAGHQPRRAQGEVTVRWRVPDGGDFLTGCARTAPKMRAPLESAPVAC